MSLWEKLNQELTAAMKQRLKDRVAALRLVVAVLQNLQIAKRTALTDEEVVAALRKEAKKRLEAKAIYEQAGRNDLAAKEEGELKVIRQWL